MMKKEEQTEETRRGVVYFGRSRENEKASFAKAMTLPSVCLLLGSRVLCSLG